MLLKVSIGSLQVFHSLLKAHTMEARAIVRQAMAILTPAVPARMEDGHQMLTHWTRKIIVEEGHTVPQLVHILHLIVQHFRVCKITLLSLDILQIILLSSIHIILFFIAQPWVLVCLEGHITTEFA